jgi:hypothetical protein
MIDKLTDGDNFLDIFLKNKKYIYLTSVTHEYCEMAYNWFISLKNINSDHLCLVIALDEKCYTYMKHHSIPSVYLECNINSNLTGEDWIKNERETKVLAPYYIFKKYNIDIIVSDVDIIFLKDPIDKLNEEINDGYDICVMSDKRFHNFIPERKIGKSISVDDSKRRVIDNGFDAQTLYGYENGGFFYMKKDKKDKILDCFSVFYKDSDYYKKYNKLNEEQCLQSLTIKRYKESHLKVKVLSCFEFVNGSLWNIPYLKNKVKDNCYIVHYNFCDYMEPLKVKEDKTNKMKQNNHWFFL